MDVRKITFMNTSKKNYSTNKWTNLDDRVFNNIVPFINTENTLKIADLLNLFYYFIVSYSKNCFKKNALWNTIYTRRNTFNYSLANSMNSHELLLAIQKKLYIFRKEYSIVNSPNYYSTEKITEILQFVNQSLHEIITYIAPPVKFISLDILQKLNKYTNITQKTNTTLPNANANPKYDSTILQSIIINSSDLDKKSNMIEFVFTSNSTTN